MLQRFADIRNLPVWGLMVLALLVSVGCSSSGRSFEAAVPAPESDASVDVRKIWSYRIARGQDGQFLFLEPAVIGEQVFAATADGFITAHNANNGRRDWWIRWDYGLLGGVGADSNYLYLTDRRGYLVALDPEEGAVRWETAMPNEVVHAPQSNGNTVVVHTIDGSVLGYDARSGERRWQYDAVVPALSFRGNSTPYVDQDAVITGLDNGQVVALDVNNGRLYWQYAVGVPSGRTELERLVDVDGQPLVQNNVVYVTGHQGRLAALEQFSGEERWSRSVSSLQSPALSGRHVFVATDDGQMVAFDQNTQSETWRNGDFSWRRLTAPVIHANHILVGDYEGYLYALRQRDGRVVGRTQVDDRGLRSRIIPYGDRILVLGNGGHLASYRLIER